MSPGVIALQQGTVRTGARKARAERSTAGGPMNRRSFLAATAGSGVVGAVPTPAPSSPRSAQSANTVTRQPDGLNPPGIRTAGIRMVPVAGGKYKVWTKRIGSGRLKVLILHGGPGFSHEY